MRLVPITLFCATFLAAPLVSPAAGQGSVPVPKPAPGQASPQAPTPAHASFMASPSPTFDEGSARRIAAAMLSYSALEVRGGWPVLPKSVGNLRPGSTGPDVALLRERLAIADDLAPDHVAGDVFDATVTAAVRRFQVARPGS